MTSPVSADALDALFTPRSITIVGASDDPRRIGGRPLAHMIQQRFDGAVYPVNPKRDTAQGLRCYPSVSDIDDRLDFVLIAVPAPDVAPALRAAAAKGARTALIFSAGFAEIGDDGAAMQAELAEIARTTGVRVIGPNCLGLFNSAARFYPTFTSTIDRATPVPGGIAIASQSPELVSRLVLVDSMCYPARPDAARRVAELPLAGGFVFKQLWGKTMFRSYFREALSSPSRAFDPIRIDEYYEAFNSPASRNSALATFRGTRDTRSVVADVARINVPSLVVWGRHDAV
ncbi:MAG: CoA-binding protein, partial [Rhodobacteraceae bacterium]|nr:CoA-binding protein [Paracoccaceae bacterium]